MILALAKSHRLLARASALLVLVALGLGCPHRSPEWSPDGQQLLVLVGREGEACDAPASSLWLINATNGEKQRVKKPPHEKCRFLAVRWIDPQKFLAFTTQWEDGQVIDEGEKIWLGDSTSWKEVKGPRPNAARVTRRLPVVLRSEKGVSIVYPTDDEILAIVSLANGKTLHEIEPAEIIGPGPQGGFLVWRPEDSDTGGIEIAAISGDAQDLWTQSFSKLRKGIATKLDKKPLDIVFNDASTSHVPAGKQPAQWVGLVVNFSDVSWPQGITGFYVQLDAKSGELLHVVQGRGVPGQPMGNDESAWCGLSGSRGQGTPKLTRLDLKSGNPTAVLPLTGVGKNGVHGYSLSPQGNRFAVSVNGAPARITIHSSNDLAVTKTIELDV